MKLLSCEVENFASYDYLSFNFDSLGLALVHGVTGSGKSTLCDIPTWILFGATAKNGNADDVRSWNNPTTVTQGILTIQLNGHNIQVTRIRGKAGQNDLFFHIADGSTPVRGKDLTETQKLLNQYIGMDANTYFTSAYYCEYSPANIFFIGNAKLRRQVFEKIANLDFAVKLNEKLTESKKPLKNQIDELQKKVSKQEGIQEHLKDALMHDQQYVSSWNEQHETKLEELQTVIKNYEDIKQSEKEATQLKHERFEQERNKTISELKSRKEKLAERLVALSTIKYSSPDLKKTIVALEKEKCPTCGGPYHTDKYKQLKQQQEVVNSAITEHDLLKERFFSIVEKVNTHESAVNPNIWKDDDKSLLLNKQLKDEEKAINPYVVQIEKHLKELRICELTLKTDTNALNALNHKYSSIAQLQDLTVDLRGTLVSRVMQEVQYSTNRYLETYFEGALRVDFTVNDGDTAEVSIQKDGHDCVFRQLSKGQRQLLRLCFGISVMKAASNRSGIHLDNLFFDEALDGLDADLKVKAFNLFSELEKDHGSIVVIDHSSELKEMFSNQFTVHSDSGNSTISKYGD